MITILSIADRIACFYSLKPFFFCKGDALFTFTTSADYCLRRDKNKILIMMRQFIKPDMSHLETWPNIFAPGETCVFFSWDADDLVEKAHYYVEHKEERDRIAANAQKAYSAALSSMNERFPSIIKEITE